MDNKLADRLEKMENEELGDLMRIIGRDELIITSGSQQALDIVAKLFLNQGDKKL